MTTPNTRSRHTERRFSGEREGASVAKFLNHEPNEEGRQRILSLLGMLKRIFAAGTYRGGLLTPRLDEVDQFMDMAASFNKLFREQYRGGSPALLEGTGEAAALGENLFVWRLTEAFFTTNSATDRENVAAHFLVELAKMQLLDSLTQCKFCGQWLFGRFAHQQFCRKECRIKFNASTEEAKKYRRDMAREYYRLHKLGYGEKTKGDNHVARKKR